jgi:type I restriction enzyme S subunit
MQKLLTKGIGHTKFKKTELGEMPEEWEIKGLTKVFNIIDYRGRTPPFSENGIPYIGADNIKDARIVFNKRRYVSEETYTEYMTRGIPNPDDIFFTTEAPLGNVAQVPEYKFCFAQRVVVFRCKNDFSPLFFMYLLKTKIMQKQFLDWATGTTVTGISSKNMKFIKLYYPKSIQEQKKIGRVLESVDKYIDSEKENLLSLQELKKGLMQDLLTGKVRVCV